MSHYDDMTDVVDLSIAEELYDFGSAEDPMSTGLLILGGKDA